MGKIGYTAYFVDDVEKLKREIPPVDGNYDKQYYHHLTIQFKPKNLDGIEVGKKVILKGIGRLTTLEIDVLLIDEKGILTKNNNPHITLSTASGIKPFKSNVALENNKDEIIYFETPIEIPATMGYFEYGTGEVTQNKIGENIKLKNLIRINEYLKMSSENLQKFNREAGQVFNRLKAYIKGDVELEKKYDTMFDIFKDIMEKKSTEMETEKGINLSRTDDYRNNKKKINK